MYHSIRSGGRGRRAAIVASVWLFLFLAPAAAGPPAQLEWSEEQLELEVPPGAGNSATVSFTVNEDTGPLTISVVPALEPFVQLSPAETDALEAGETVDVIVDAALPPEQPGSARAGTLHVREGKRSLAPPLNLRLIVAEGQGPRGPTEESFSPGTLSPVGLSETGFNATDAPVAFVLEEAAFDTRPGHVTVFHNGERVAEPDVAVSDSGLEMPAILTGGRNVIEVVGSDAEGRIIDERFVFWAGGHRLTGMVVDRSGQPVPEAELTITLTRAPEVNASGQADAAGLFAFDSLPPLAVHIEGRAEPDLFGAVPANGDDGSAQLVLFDFRPPSSVDNNDFSQGLDGWETGTAPVFLIEHDQALFSTEPEPAATTTTEPEDREAAHRAFQDQMKTPEPTQTSDVGAAQSDLDLVLQTAGEGPQVISRTFEPDSGTRAVAVRYRFITTEVPGGWCGTEFDDSFGVYIRAAASGASVAETNSMNGLGCGAFDGSGRTEWRERTLPLGETDSETVQIDLMVANVGDGLFDSFLRVDLIEEEELAITDLRLGDLIETTGYAGNYGAAETRLGFLGLAGHPYFGGNTRVYGTLRLEGPEDATVESVELDIIQGGAVRGSAGLTAQAASALETGFGSDGVLEISNTAPLFEFNPAAVGINLGNDGTVSLRVRARTASGEEAIEEAGSAGILARPAGLERYGTRDATWGGDDWAQPTLVAIAEAWPDDLRWNDFSKMNGGPFPPHTTHRRGADADVWFFGYNDLDADTAARIIDLLNTDAGSSIDAVLVTYELTDDDPFYQAIQDVVLDSGQMATDIIRSVPHHDGHFHIRY